MSVADYVVTRGLNKPVEKYGLQGPAPPAVAKAMLKEGRAVNVGDHIPHVICLDEHGHSSNKGVAERTVHPDHVDPDTTAVDKRPGMEKEGVLMNQMVAALIMTSSHDDGSGGRPRARRERT